jgi:hypothetical protein
VTAPHLNGAGPAAGWPSAPVLLAPVPLPFSGSYEGVTVWYDVDAAKRLAQGQDARAAVYADLLEEETALARRRLPATEKVAADADLFTELCVRLILLTVARLSGPWPGPPPPADDPATWLAMHAIVLEWIAFDGIAAAEAEYGGPKLMRRSRAQP